MFEIISPDLEEPLAIRKVLVIYVGGTIGMKRNPNGVYCPLPNQLLEELKLQSQMHDPKFAKSHLSSIKSNVLVLPPVGRNVVLYEVMEYHPLLDSSNMSANEWVRIAKDIEANHDRYNGFVVLHGTDTLAYTSSALSFMLEGLQKPVILTGSQIPIFETRSDAKDNILASLILAGCYHIPEVCILFAHKLLRGNRTAKISSTHLAAFDSPNYHPLADVGIKIMMHNHYILEPNTKTLKVNTKLNQNVGLISFFPTITPAMLQAFLQPPIEGAVVETYGSGNIPLTNKNLLQVLKDAVKRGVVIVNITQCAQGVVSSSYEGAKALEEIGVISGRDMTAEAALTKLCYILGLPNLLYEDKIKLVKSNVRGELTLESKPNSYGF